MGGESGYFEHGADVGIFGRGASPELAFQQAAKAMFALMTETGTRGRARKASRSSSTRPTWSWRW